MQNLGLNYWKTSVRLHSLSNAGVGCSNVTAFERIIAFMQQSAAAGAIHVENPESQTRWYFKFFLGRLHQNYVGLDAEREPFILSVILSDGAAQLSQYKAILWRKRVRALRSVPLRLALHRSNYAYKDEV